MLLMRARPGGGLAAAVAAVLLALALGACGGKAKSAGVASLGGSSGNGSTQSAGGSQDPYQQALQFARCMRDHGVNMPDPKPSAGGGFAFQVTGGKNDKAKLEAALSACQKYQPRALGGEGKNSQEVFQKALAFARCMRQHGIVMPDPQMQGGGITQRLSGNLDPSSPRFQAAQQACQNLLPNGGRGLSTRGGGK